MLRITNARTESSVVEVCAGHILPRFPLQSRPPAPSAERPETQGQHSNPPKEVNLGPLGMAGSMHLTLNRGVVASLWLGLPDR